MVEKAVVGNIDKELGRGRMGVVGTRHGQSANIVGQTVVRFIFNGITGGFFLHVGVHTATLDHKAGNNTVENSAVVKTVAGVLQVVGRRGGGVGKIQFNGDITLGGAQCNHKRSLYLCLTD